MKKVALSEIKDDWFDYQLENDPRFLARIEAARQSLRQGRGVRLEALDLPRRGSPQRPGRKRR